MENGLRLSGDSIYQQAHLLLVRVTNRGLMGGLPFAHRAVKLLGEVQFIVREAPWKLLLGNKAKQFD
ncbi:hypothetical protein [Bradyrhizobium sp. USDA 3650]